jgi:predicted CoA-substrate-specific enzyme activase
MFKGYLFEGGSMRAYLGIDAGTVYFKSTLFTPTSTDGPPETMPFFNGYLDISRGRIYFLDCVKFFGEPLKTVEKHLRSYFDILKNSGYQVILCSTGRLGKTVAKHFGGYYENEFGCIAKAVSECFPEANAVFEIGAETSKFINLKRERDGRLIIDEYGTNGECAAGTGSFIDQQASRMKVEVEKIGESVRDVKHSARIAGRCSVFAKTDMIHAQQKGATPEQILKGLTYAVARNYKSNVFRGRKLVPPVLFLGGVAANGGVFDALSDTFQLDKRDIIRPPYYRHYSAAGVAILVSGKSRDDAHAGVKEKQSAQEKERLKSIPSQPPLVKDNVVFLRDSKNRTPDEKPDASLGDVYIGIDVGSVSTNFAILSDRGNVIEDVYVSTDGRPVSVVSKNLKELGKKLDEKVTVRGIATTGSGRELIGELVGADVIIDEITAHKTGASYVAMKSFGSSVDTIFEIGGQDSKFISIRDGIVVDFAMNDACAAGTGSFLEEQATKIGVQIKGEFADLAFSSKNPLRLGERCTVFMEQDVSSYMKKGAVKEDIVAGLAYAVVLNYLNRVVRGRPLGEKIYFQGGTAYNDSVAAAFSIVLGKQIIVPPHNGVMGAIGAALVAKEKQERVNESTKFRGFNLEGLKLDRREFLCRGCSNECEVKEISIEGEKTYWGDKCSERFRKPPKVPVRPISEDLVGYKVSLLNDYLEEGDRRGKYLVGVPRSLYFYERFPFWHGFFKYLDVSLRATPQTSRVIAQEGFDVSLSEPCFPVKAALGHVSHMMKEMDEADFYFLPNVINAEHIKKSTETFYCPWGQTLPFVVSANPELAKYMDSKVISPTVYFRDGEKFVANDLYSSLKKFGWKKSTIKDAIKFGYETYKNFTDKIDKAGKRAVREIEEGGGKAILLLGRPYNIYDREMNLNIPGKIREHYGLDVVPYEFIPQLDEIDIQDLNWNMFWNLGSKLIKAARWAEEKDCMSIIFITNFNCGPDSFIRHYIEKASGRPFLILQFDGHGNDAGYMTRVEAHLDSRGVMRWWRDGEAERT